MFCVSIRAQIAVAFCFVFLFFGCLFLLKFYFSRAWDLHFLFQAGVCEVLVTRGEGQGYATRHGIGICLSDRNILVRDVRITSRFKYILEGFVTRSRTMHGSMVMGSSQASHHRLPHIPHVR